MLCHMTFYCLNLIVNFIIWGSAHKLVHSFLNRKQFVSVNNIKSAIKRVTYGVAQGFTLGPLSFLLYISDLPCSTSCLPQLDTIYDTCLVVNSTELTLANVYNRLQDNTFQLNSVKSNNLIVFLKRHANPSQICSTLKVL